MGFRKHRRRGGGGGGGGFGGHHHHHHGFGTGEPNGLQPGDDVGNRRSFKPVIVPPDDLGNRRDPDEAEWVPEDNVGNRIDAAPTHELSGVLLDLDGKRRRRRPKGVSAPERVGRFFVGGVNPLIATNVPRAFPGKTLEESLNGGGGGGGFSGGGDRGGGGGPGSEVLPSDVNDVVGGPDDAFGRETRGHNDDGRDGRDGRGGGYDDGGGPEGAGEGGGRRRRRRGRGGGGRDQVDGVQAQEVSERRAQRFFDFDEDDRFEYTLKTTAEQKRLDAEDAVRSVVVEAGRDGVVSARLIEDGSRPKVLVTIDERGPASSVPAERRSQNAQEPLFVMGNAALMSLNYLVNKIVNRYPDDRIRLAILPLNDQKLYLDALDEHRRLRRPNGATATTTAGSSHATGSAPGGVMAPASSTEWVEPSSTSQPPPEDRIRHDQSIMAAVDVEPGASILEPTAKNDVAKVEAVEKAVVKADAGAPVAGFVSDDDVTQPESPAPATVDDGAEDGDDDDVEAKADDDDSKPEAKTAKPKRVTKKKAAASSKDDKAAATKKPLRGRTTTKKAPAVEVVRTSRPKST